MQLLIKLLATVLRASVDTVHCVRICSALCCTHIWMPPILTNYRSSHAKLDDTQVLGVINSLNLC
jgi:hypothetical protein